jgi:Amt family ammonium transporter
MKTMNILSHPLLKRLSLVPLFLLVVGASSAAAQDAAGGLSAPDTAWLLMATAMVLLMTPALGFFYGGLVREKNALNTLMMSFVALGIAGVLWPIIGYSLAFGEGSAWVGNFSMVFLNGVGLDSGGSIPDLLFMAFQGTFAIITAALISGAVVERMRFNAYVLFIALWSLLVYAPVAHWVWGGGWLEQMGALDFAGGAVVHVNAGAAALVAALVLGTRKDYGRQALLPHNVPFVLLGAGMLWFGWFGFNGGSALASDQFAVLALVNTMLAPAAAIVVWMIIDGLRTETVTAVGTATAIVVGLVAITPAAGFVPPMASLAVGGLAVIPSYFLILWQSRTKFDDSLDVFAAHGVGGISGALLTGVFASAAWSGGATGVLSGNVGQFGIQAVSVLVVFAYSAALTWLILKGIGLFMTLRPPVNEEGLGLDIVDHGEEAYTEGEGAVLVLADNGSEKTEDDEHVFA